MNTKNIDTMKTFRLFSACAFLLLGATLLVAPMGAQPHRHKATQERQHHNFGMSASPRGHGRYHENGKHGYKRGGRHNGNDGYSRGIARGHEDFVVAGAGLTGWTLTSIWAAEEDELLRITAVDGL